jgi:hypothetical protein
VIESQEMLRLLTVETFTHKKDREREKLHKQLFRSAYPDSINEKQFSDMDLKKALGGR